MSSELGLVGHHAARRAVLTALQRHRLPHALLITGVEGIGKRLFAEWLVAAAWCTGKPAPCGTCGSCRKLATDNHQDRTIVARLVPGEGQEGSGSEITVGSIRTDVLGALALRPVEAPGRAILLDGADEMNAEAQNALLHTLEEPPPDSLLLLVTSRPERLLPTVRSRCQELRLQPLDEEEMRRFAGDVDAGRLALAAGRPGKLAALRTMDVHGLLGAFDALLGGGLGGAEFAARCQALAQAAELPGGPRDIQRWMLEVLHARLRDWAVPPDTPRASAALLALPATGPGHGALREAERAVLEAGEDVRRHLPAEVVWAALGRAVRTLVVGAGTSSTP